LGDIFVARLDPAGNWLWAVKAGGVNRDWGGNVGLDAAGNCYVTGSFSSEAISFGNTTLTNTDAGVSDTYDVFVAKLSPQGNWLWARSGGGNNDDEGTALALDADANVYVTGHTQGADAKFGSHAVTGLASANENVLVTKLTTNGDWLWAVRAGGNLYKDAGWAITTDGASNAYITGRFCSPTATFGATTLTNTGGGSREKGDAFIAKITAAGQWQWATQARGDDDEYGSGIALDGAGQLAVVGTFASSTAQLGATTLTNTAGGKWMSAPTSLFLAHLSPDGAWLDAVSSQHGEGQRLPSVTADVRGNISVAGNFQGSSFTLGGTTLTGGTGGPSTGFVTLVSSRPVIASFAPSSGVPGQVVTLVGSGFINVTQVLFNDTPATAFTVQSATRLLATVPPGITPGLMSVRTATGSASSPEVFQPLALAATSAQPNLEAALWPNPAAAGEPWQVRQPTGTPAGLTQATVRNVLGQVVFTAQFGGSTVYLPVPRLAPGVYQLTLTAAGQATRQHRVVVAE